MDARILLFVLFGVALIISVSLERWLSARWMSLPIVYVAAGFAIFSLPIGLPHFNPARDGFDALTLEYVTEFIVIASLAAAGVAIDRPVSWKNWRQIWPLLVIAMPITIAAMALPCQSSLASLTPPYRIPHEAIALVPMAAAAAVLGLVLGAVWFPRRSWFLAPAMAFAFHALSAAFVLSWRRLELPLDPALLGVACTIGAAALLATGLGRGVGWLWRRGAWEG